MANNSTTEDTLLPFHLGLYNELVLAITKLEDAKTSGGLSPDFSLNFLSDVGAVFGAIKLVCIGQDASFDRVSELLVSLNLAKMFFELVTKCDRSLPELREMFSMVTKKGSSFLHSVFSYHTEDKRLDFSVAEAVAFYLFACHSLSCCKEGYILLRDILSISQADGRFTLRLLVVERLCQSQQYNSCEAFDNFITGGDGVLSSGIVTRATRSVENTLRTFRIWTKIVETESGRRVLFEHIEQLLGGHQAFGENRISRYHYIKLLNFAFTCDCDGFTSRHLISTAASKVLAMFSNVQTTVSRHTSTTSCFGGKGCESDSNIDAIIFVNLILKLVSLAKDEREESEADYAVLRWLKSYVMSLGIEGTSSSTETSLSKMLISLFIEQDDELVDFLLLQLQLHHSMNQSSTSTELEEVCIVQPHRLFFDLLQGISYDSSVLLDWLVSNETQFLQYFVKYLKLAVATWEDFVEISMSKSFQTMSSEQSAHKFDLTTETLQKLKKSICRLVKADLFPYSPKPLIKLLDAMESKSN